MNVETEDRYKEYLDAVDLSIINFCNYQMEGMDIVTGDLGFPIPLTKGENKIEWLTKLKEHHSSHEKLIIIDEIIDILGLNKIHPIKILNYLKCCESKYLKEFEAGDKTSYLKYKVSYYFYEFYMFFRTFFQDTLRVDILNFYLHTFSTEEMISMFESDLKLYSKKGEKVYYLNLVKNAYTQLNVNEDKKKDIKGLFREDEKHTYEFYDLIYQRKWVDNRLRQLTYKLKINFTKAQLKAGLSYLIDDVGALEVADLTSFLNGEFDTISAKEEYSRDNTYAITLKRNDVKNEAAKNIILFFGLLHKYNVILNSKTKTKSWILKVFGNYHGFGKDNIHHFISRSSEIDKYEALHGTALKAIFK